MMFQANNKNNNNNYSNNNNDNKTTEMAITIIRTTHHNEFSSECIFYIFSLVGDKETLLANDVILYSLCMV